MLEDGTTVEPALASIAENNLSIFIHGIRPQTHIGGLMCPRS